MEGTIAVLGFWICMLAMVMKKPLLHFIEKRKIQQTQDVAELSQRVFQLEVSLANMSKDMLEMKDTTEFSQKLLKDSTQQVTQLSKLIAEQAANHTAQIAMARQSFGSGGAGGAGGAGEPKLIQSKKENNEIKLLTNNESLYSDVPLIDLGKIVNEHTVRFVRTLPASVDRVWEYISTSELLPKWLASGNIEPRMGGRVELNFDTEEMPERNDKGAQIRGLVSWFEPQRGLAFSWIDTNAHLETVVSFELTPQGNQTSLVVTHSRLPKDRMHEFMAGWHTHLDVLQARLSRMVPPDFRKRFGQVVTTYAAIVTAVVISSGPASAATGSGINPNAYQTIQTERSHLMEKYDLLWRDADDLQRKISLLKHDNSSEAAYTVDKLDRELQNEYRDLHQTELEIRDLDRALH